MASIFYGRKEQAPIPQIPHISITLKSQSQKKHRPFYKTAVLTTSKYYYYLIIVVILRLLYPRSRAEVSVIILLYLHC